MKPILKRFAVFTVYLEEDEVENGLKIANQEVKPSIDDLKVADNNRNHRDLRDAKSGKFFKDPRDVKKVTSLNTVESIVNQLLEKQKEKVSCPEKGPECPCDSTTKPPTPKNTVASHQPSIVSVHTPRSEASIVQVCDIGHLSSASLDSTPK